MPAAPPFAMSIHSFTPPELPDQPKDVPKEVVKSSLMPSVAPPTTPLYFTLSLPTAREKNPLYPASHLQLAYHFEGSGEILLPKFITSEDLVKSDKATEDEPNLYEVEVPPEDILRVKVNDGQTTTGTLKVRAWRREKLLGEYIVGQIERLAFEGFKSEPLFHLRTEAMAKRREEERAKLERRGIK